MISLNVSDFLLDTNRLSFYFDKFKYKMVISLEGIQYFRNCQSKYEIDNKIFSYKSKKNLYYYDDIKLIMNDNIKMSDISNVIEWKQTVDKTKIKFVTTDNKISIYSDDHSIFENLLNSVKSIHKFSTFYYVEKMKNYVSGDIYLKSPKYKFRIYLKCSNYKEEQKQKLKEFLDYYKMSKCPSLNRWLNDIPTYNPPNSFSSYVRSWAWDYYFFEFDDESLITMISLKFDNLIGKVCTVHKR